MHDETISSDRDTLTSILTSFKIFSVKRTWNAKYSILHADSILLTYFSLSSILKADSNLEISILRENLTASSSAAGGSEIFVLRK